MLNVIPLPAFDDNYIWIIHLPDKAKVIVVDPGDSDVVENYLADQQLELGAILVTHHHDDHVRGVKSLSNRRQVPVFGPGSSDISDITREVTDNDRIEFEGLCFRVMATPGHTLDHLIYFLEGNEPHLFTGDLIFSAGCGRIFEGTAHQMFNALKQVKKLPGNTLLYPAHEYTLGNLTFAQTVEPENKDIRLYQEMCSQTRSRNKSTLPVTLANELSINPFLRTDKQSVKEAASRYQQSRLKEEADTFAVLRRWKDSF